MDRALDAQIVALGRVRTDPSDFRVKHEPGHPSADANGNVKYPNVNSLVEMTDMREAQRSYEANINVIGASRRMIQRTHRNPANPDLESDRWPHQASPPTPMPVSPVLTDPSGLTKVAGEESGGPSFGALLKDAIKSR